VQDHPGKQVPEG